MTSKRLEQYRELAKRAIEHYEAEIVLSNQRVRSSAALIAIDVAFKAAQPARIILDLLARLEIAEKAFAAIIDNDTGYGISKQYAEEARAKINSEEPL